MLLDMENRGIYACGEFIPLPKMLKSPFVALQFRKTG